MLFSSPGHQTCSSVPAMGLQVAACAEKRYSVFHDFTRFLLVGHFSCFPHSFSLFLFCSFFTICSFIQCTCILFCVFFLASFVCPVAFFPYISLPFSFYIFFVLAFQHLLFCLSAYSSLPFLFIRVPGLMMQHIRFRFKWKGSSTQQPWLLQLSM